MLNVNVAGWSTAVSAIDVWDEATNKVNFLVQSNGNVFCRELRVKTGSIPDFVFDKNYKLMSLAEREAFIKTQKHLPYMLSAKEIETENNDAPIGQMMTGILQNTEELTLYVIELKKEIEALKAELQMFKKK